MPQSMQPFFWYELMTPDAEAAAAFYAAVVGWTAERYQGGDYRVMMAGATGVAGIMAAPEEARGAPPAWFGYVFAPDVDEAVRRLEAAGGTVRRAPSEIPGVGRFAVVADPHGAAFMLMTPQGPDPQERPAPDAIGHVGWRELHAGDLETAFAFYAGQFGWTKADAVDMGEMGIYQLFNSGPGQQGGMMTKHPSMPAPAWQFYFTVDAIDAAAARIASAGGKVVAGPMEVPGGSFILQGMDPQGAIFALTAAKR